VAPITANFTSEAHLSRPVLEAITAALEQGWADPKKLSQASGVASQLQTAAVEEFAAILGVRGDEIEVCGESNLLPYLSLQGLLYEMPTLATTTVDVGKVRAVARSYQGSHTVLGVSSVGEVDFSALPKDCVLSLQSVNGETGARQRFIPDTASVAYDATADIPHQLPRGIATATFSSSSWGGPSGVGFLVIKDAHKFRYPLPHIAPIRTPGSYSLPLLIGSVVAATERLSQKNSIQDLRKKLISALGDVPYLSVVEAINSESSPHISLLIDGLSNQEFMSSLNRNGLEVDAGSACSPEDIAPSHVIAAMGLPTEGHIRLALRNTLTLEDIDNCAAKIKETINQLRS
jgi:cysteine desulfurase